MCDEEKCEVKDTEEVEMIKGSEKRKKTKIV